MSRAVQVYKLRESKHFHWLLTPWLTPAMEIQELSLAHVLELNSFLSDYNCKPVQSSVKEGAYIYLGKKAKHNRLFGLFRGYGGYHIGRDFERCFSVRGLEGKVDGHCDLESGRNPVGLLAF